MRLEESRGKEEKFCHSQLKGRYAELRSFQ